MVNAASMRRGGGGGGGVVEWLGETISMWTVLQCMLKAMQC